MINKYASIEWKLWRVTLRAVLNTGRIALGVNIDIDRHSAWLVVDMLVLTISVIVE